MMLKAETLAVKRAIDDLLHAITLDPAFDKLADKFSFRVAVDCREELILISIVANDGRSLAVGAIPCGGPESPHFGEIGIPAPVAGLYESFDRLH